MTPRMLVAVVVVAFLGAAAVTAAALRTGPGAAVGSPAAARTAFPDLPTPTGEPGLPSLTRLRPEPGQVVVATGPFDDRFTLDALRFDGRTVRGRATITSDVSEVLEFQAVAGFYDRRGTLLGTARYVHHVDESGLHLAESGPPDEDQAFAIAVPPALRGAAVAAAVGVPVLVNE